MALVIRRFLIRNATLMAFLVFVCSCLFAQDGSGHVGPFVGKWLTSSKQGVVEIYDCGGTLCGRVVGLRQNRDANGLPWRDGYNPDPEARNRPVCGSMVFRNLQWNDQKSMWAGRLYDAENGKEYEGRLTVERPGEMRLRGSLVHFSWLSETVIWTLYQGELSSDCGMKESFAMKSGTSARGN